MAKKERSTQRQEMIAAYLQCRSDCYLPTKEALDALLDLNVDKASFFCEIASFPHEWFDDFLPALNWWRAVGDVALETSLDQNELGPDPALKEQRHTLSRLLADVLQAFLPALQESSPYSAEFASNGDEAIELLKRYRLYTRAVEQLVLHVWPMITID